MAVGLIDQNAFIRVPFQRKGKRKKRCKHKTINKWPKGIECVYRAIARTAITTLPRERRSFSGLYM